MRGQGSINRVKNDSRWYDLESMTRRTRSLTIDRIYATLRAYLQSSNKENDYDIALILVSFRAPSVTVQR